jgi:hypothetical protein
LPLVEADGATLFALACTGPLRGPGDLDPLTFVALLDADFFFADVLFFFGVITERFLGEQ